MNPLKCRFCVPEVVCLGHLVSAKGIQPVVDKVAAIMELPQPTSVKGTMGFFGDMDQYRKYISGYAAMCVPLQLLTRLNVPFVRAAGAVPSRRLSMQ
jgi:hypothetical protein